MNKKIIAAVVVIALVVVGAVFYWKNTNPSSQVPVRKTIATVPLASINNSGETGNAIITELDNAASLELRLTGAPSGSKVQPAHLHAGTCAQIGDVSIGLAAAVNGSSITPLGISAETLKAKLPLAVVVHKSETEMNTYVACGDIPGAPVVNPSPTPTPSPSPSASESHTITITSTGFSPSKLTIKKGESVTFKNEGDAGSWPASAMHPTHTVYPGSDIKKCGTAEASKIFDACHNLKKGESWTFTFGEVGTWRYHDHSNPKLFGQIVVE